MQLMITGSACALSGAVCALSGSVCALSLSKGAATDFDRLSPR